jgi:hypothetical protein
MKCSIFVQSAERQPRFLRNISPPPAGSKINQARIHDNFRFLPAVCVSLAWVTPQYWSWKRHIPPKRRLALNGLKGVIS